MNKLIRRSLPVLFVLWVLPQWNDTDALQRTGSLAAIILLWLTVYGLLKDPKLSLSIEDGLAYVRNVSDRLVSNPSIQVRMRNLDASLDAAEALLVSAARAEYLEPWGRLGTPLVFGESMGLSSAGHRLVGAAIISGNRCRERTFWIEMDREGEGWFSEVQRHERDQLSVLISKGLHSSSTPLHGTIPAPRRFPFRRPPAPRSSPVSVPTGEFIAAPIPIDVPETGQSPVRERPAAPRSRRPRLR